MVQGGAEKMDSFSSRKESFAYMFWTFIVLLLKKLTLQLKTFSSARDLKNQPVYPQQGLQTLLPSNENKSQPLIKSNYIVHSFEIKYPSRLPLSSSSLSLMSPSSSLTSPSSSSMRSLPSPLSSSSSSSPCNSLIKAMSLASPHKPCSPYIYEVLGTESGACMDSNEEEDKMWLEITERRTQPFSKKNKGKCVAPKEYPPPLPSLARTGNLACRMPWVFTRHYENGRLIIVEQKVEHHEYFEDHRENGCLRLTLVPMDDLCCHDNDDGDEVMESEDDEIENVTEEKEALSECPENSKLCPNASVYEVGSSSQSNEPGSDPLPSFICPIATVNIVA